LGLFPKRSQKMNLDPCFDQDTLTQVSKSNDLIFDRSPKKVHFMENNLAGGGGVLQEQML